MPPRQDWFFFYRDAATYKIEAMRTTETSAGAFVYFRRVSWPGEGVSLRFS